MSSHRTAIRVASTTKTTKSLRRATAVLAGAFAVAAMAAPGAQAAGDPAPCSVRNITQDTTGDSFIVMNEAAVDGDRLRVSGTCAGGARITRDLAIRGVGDAPSLVGGGPVDGDGFSLPVVSIARRATVTIRALDLSGGRAYVCGGLSNEGQLTLIDSVVRQNGAYDICGGIGNSGTMILVGSVVSGNVSSTAGGIWNTGTMTITDSVIRGNGAAASGGGIMNMGTLRIVASLVRRNRGHQGGGIWNGGDLLLRTTTVKGNRGVHGAGIANDGEADGAARLVLRGSVVYGNTANRRGGGIFNRAATLELHGSRVTGNSAGHLGGGITNVRGVVSLRDGSTVTRNSPDECFGITAC